MANASPQHELVGVLVNRYPQLALRLAELTGQVPPAHERAVPAPNAHQVRKEGKRRQVISDATVHLLRDGKKCHFYQVEMQRDYSWNKLATLRAYHGSEVRNAECGGHVIVLSPRAAVAESFARAEEEATERLAFSVSYLAGRGLRPLAEKDRPFEDRALAAALTDLRAALTDLRAGLDERTIPMLMEMREHDDTMADLFLAAILEECPDESELEDALSELAMQRLQGLPSFQRWSARVRAEAKAEAEAKAKAEADARAEAARAEADARAGAQAEAAAAKAFVQSLLSYFSARKDVPSVSALEAMQSCTKPMVAQSWLNRAYAGETSAEIFPENPENPDRP